MKNPLLIVGPRHWRHAVAQVLSLLRSGVTLEADSVEPTALADHPVRQALVLGAPVLWHTLNPPGEVWRAYVTLRERLDWWAGAVLVTTPRTASGLRGLHDDLGLRCGLGAPLHLLASPPCLRLTEALEALRAASRDRAWQTLSEWQAARNGAPEKRLVELLEGWQSTGVVPHRARLTELLRSVPPFLFDEHAFRPIAERLIAGRERPGDLQALATVTLTAPER